MSSMQASQKGLIQIKQAIAQKGWKVGDDRWLMEASKILEPSGKWQIGGPYAYGCSLQTWERFLQRTPIR
ncbi:MAG: ATP-binding protein, partial [Pseudomonadota bacterium]